MAGLPYGRRRLLLRGRVNALSRCILSLLAGIFWLVPDVVVAQDLTIDPTISDGETRITEVVFEGDLFFDEAALNLRIRSRPNRKLLGLPGFTWWLWLHNFGAHTLGGGRVGRAFMATGEPPALFDSTTVASDLERLLIFYRDEGFQQAVVSVDVRPERSPEHVAIRFSIDPGPPTFIRNFKYNGLGALSREQQLRVVEGSLLDLDVSPDDPDPLSHTLENTRYSAPLLTEEGRRLQTVLRNEGYALVARDSVHAVVYRWSPEFWDVTIDVNPGPRYRFGDVHFSVTGPEVDAEDRAVSDSMGSGRTGVAGGLVSATFQSERSLDFDLLQRKLDFSPGDWYNQSLLLSTKRRLDATGAFAFTEIQTVLTAPPSGVTGADSTRSVPGPPRISHRFTVQTRPRHQMRLQTFVLQRYGIGSLPETENEWGFGAGVSYSNLNLFGEGENFTISGTGSLASEFGVGGFSSAQWEIRTNLAFPYLTWPLGNLESWFDLDDSRSQITLSFLAARRDALRLLLRGRGLAQYRFELNHSETVTTYLDLLEFTVSNPDTLSGFQEDFLDELLASVDDPVQEAQIIQDYTEPQFNDALRLTRRWTNLNPLRREQGYAFESAIETGGNMGFLMDRFIFSSSTLEGSLPGLPIFGEAGSSNRLIYRQYLRFVVDVRKFNRINPNTTFAWKLIAGAAQPYGRANVIPLSRRFFSGGATSVRAWHLSELGPGSANVSSESPDEAALNTNIYGGEIKLEGSVELRHTVLRELFAADWIFTLFVDAGNVWFGPKNPGSDDGRFIYDEFLGQMGVGSGFGLRLAWDYLIVRLDVASKMHDPIRSGELWPDGFSHPVLHFGFGHTF